MNPGEVGRLLRERREELGLDIQDVQQATKIRARYIIAVEAGDISALPAPVYAKGFVRAIGNFLGLDGFALMQEYLADSESEPAGEAKSPKEEPSGRRGPESRRSKRPQWAQSPAGPPVARPVRNSGVSAVILIVIVFILLVAAGYTVKYLVTDVISSPDPGQESKPSPDHSGNTPSTTEPESEPGESGGETSPPTEPPNGPTSAETKLQIETAKNTAQHTITYTLKSTEGPPPDQITVDVVAQGRCWVRVTRETTNELLFEGTLSAGAEPTWSDPLGIRIRAGAPEALFLTVSSIELGKPVDSGTWTLIFRLHTE